MYIEPYATLSINTEIAFCLLVLRTILRITARAPRSLKGIRTLQPSKQFVHFTQLLRNLIASKNWKCLEGIDRRTLKMTHPIPEPFKWDNTFKVFYDHLDGEHQNLFASIFDLAENKNSQDALNKLIGVAKDHFDSEEVMMKQKDFHDHDNHKEAHDGFLDKVKGWKLPVNDDQVKYAKNWLVHHIKVTDFKYKDQLH
ncbi:unnamed protein product [Owenia fusiformis]|uniref:Hemerythrin-like domain-containing protein n=1 Tax=Owenia fusiformis TaxID=6347 RepID=A0A8J1T4Z6_OWEFU|nr:unnamed protein product [Owenia fusiformis]